MTSGTEFVFVEEIAGLCRVAPSSVRHWLSTGKLASVRPGKRRLVRRDELERFLRDSGIPAGARKSTP